MNESDLFERRFGAIVEALAYSGKSHEDIAETYGLSLDGLEQFSATWAEVIHMARWNRYRELKVRLLLGEARDLRREIARETEAWSRALEEKEIRDFGHPELN